MLKLTGLQLGAGAQVRECAGDHPHQELRHRAEAEVHARAEAAGEYWPLIGQH